MSVFSMRRESLIKGGLVVSVAFGWPILLFGLPYLWAIVRFALNWSLTAILAALAFVILYQVYQSQTSALHHGDHDDRPPGSSFSERRSKRPQQSGQPGSQGPPGLNPPPGQSKAASQPGSSAFNTRNAGQEETAEAAAPPIKGDSAKAAAPAALKAVTVTAPGYKTWADPLKKTEAFAHLEELMQQRILYIDGAMGTMIQRYKLVEDDYRGERYAKHEHELKGNNDLLVITRPDVVKEIHHAYLNAGADILETNTFNGTCISQLDYNLEAAEEVYLINTEAAKLAKQCTKEYMQKHPGSRKFVAGAIGPTNKTLSVSPSVENPAFRGITYDEVEEAYFEQIKGLYDGGVDLFLVETIFDTLNAKAAVYALERFFEEKQLRIPVFLSGTIVDNSGRTLSGQTNEAFWNSVSHAKPFAVGLNCALGASDMHQYIANLSKCADCYVFCYPNAGLPNAMGGYDQKGPEMAEEIRPFCEDRLVNALGGCCGSGPEHIAAVVKMASEYPPREKQEVDAVMRLSGLEPLTYLPKKDNMRETFLMIGERCNVAGSSIYKKAIVDGNYDKAASIATKQVPWIPVANLAVPCVA